MASKEASSAAAGPRGRLFKLSAVSSLAQQLCQDLGINALHLSQSSLQLGRGTREGQGIRLPPDWVQFSSNHCRLFYRDNCWYVQDTSTNGTFVNNGKLEKSQPSLLREGDVVRLSSTTAAGGIASHALEFRFEEELDCDHSTVDGKGDNYSSPEQAEHRAGLKRKATHDPAGGEAQVNATVVKRHASIPPAACTPTMLGGSLVKGEARSTPPADGALPAHPAAGPTALPSHPPSLAQPHRPPSAQGSSDDMYQEARNMFQANQELRSQLKEQRLMNSQMQQAHEAQLKQMEAQHKEEMSKVQEAFTQAEARAALLTTRLTAVTTSADETLELKAKLAAEQKELTATRQELWEYQATVGQDLAKSRAAEEVLSQQVATLKEALAGAEAARAQAEADAQAVKASLSAELLALEDLRQRQAETSRLLVTAQQERAEALAEVDSVKRHAAAAADLRAALQAAQDTAQEHQERHDLHLLEARSAHGKLSSIFQQYVSLEAQAQASDLAARRAAEAAALVEQQAGAFRQLLSSFVGGPMCQLCKPGAVQTTTAAAASDVLTTPAGDLTAGVTPGEQQEQGQQVTEPGSAHIRQAPGSTHRPAPHSVKRSLWGGGGTSQHEAGATTSPVHSSRALLNMGTQMIQQPTQLQQFSISGAGPSPPAALPPPPAHTARDSLGPHLLAATQTTGVLGPVQVQGRSVQQAGATDTGSQGPSSVVLPAPQPDVSGVKAHVAGADSRQNPVAPADLLPAIEGESGQGAASEGHGSGQAAGQGSAVDAVGVLCGSAEDGAPVLEFHTQEGAAVYQVMGQSEGAVARQLLEAPSRQVQQQLMEVDVVQGGEMEVERSQDQEEQMVEGDAEPEDDDGEDMVMDSPPSPRDSSRVLLRDSPHVTAQDSQQLSTERGEQVAGSMAGVQAAAAAAGPASGAVQVTPNRVFPPRLSLRPTSSHTTTTTTSKAPPHSRSPATPAATASNSRGQVCDDASHDHESENEDAAGGDGQAAAAADRGVNRVVKGSSRASAEPGSSLRSKSNVLADLSQNSCDLPADSDDDDQADVAQPQHNGSTADLVTAYIGAQRLSASMAPALRESDSQGGQAVLADISNHLSGGVVMSPAAVHASLPGPSSRTLDEALVGSALKADGVSVLAAGCSASLPEALKSPGSQFDTARNEAGAC